MTQSRSLQAIALAACLLGSGCAHEVGAAAKQTAEQATEPAITQSLRALSEPQNQEALNKLLETPAIQDAARRLSQGITEGALAGLTNEERETKIRQLSQEFVTTLMGAVGEGLNKDLRPQLTAMTTDLVDGLVREMTSPKNQQHIDAFVSALTQSMVRSLAQGMQNDLGPALHNMMSGEAGASIERASRSVARGAVLGMDDALTELDMKARKEGRPSLLGRLTGAANKGIELTTIVAVVLGLLVAALGVWIAVLIARTRRDQAEASRREAAMTMMAEAIRATEGKAWSPELQELLRTQMHEQNVHPYFRDLLWRQEQPPSKPEHH